MAAQPFEQLGYCNRFLQGARGLQLVACVTLGKSFHFNGLQYLHLQPGTNHLFTQSTQERTAPPTHWLQQLVTTDQILRRRAGWDRKEEFLDEFIAELAVIVQRGEGGTGAGKRTVGTLGLVAAVVQ